MTEGERLAILESRMDQVDRDIQDLKEKQDAAICKQQSTELEAKDLKSELSRLIGLLETHQQYHDKRDEHKYKITDIILAVGMLIIGIMQFVPMGVK